MESGIPISIFKVDSQSLSVDTPEQLEQAQESLFRRLDEDTRIEIVRWVVISKELFGGKNE